MSLPTASAGLHVRYEKAGLIFDALPIPFNADAVIIEANVRLTKKTPQEKSDFALRWSPDGPCLPAELLMAATSKTPTRILFRVRKPTETSTAYVYWRDHLLGEVEVPIVGLWPIVNAVTIDLPTVSVALGDCTIACQTFVAAQAKALVASAIIHCPNLLAPLIDLALRLDVKRADGSRVGSVKVTLPPEQLGKRQSLVSALLPKPRAVGVYEVSWWVASRCLHTHRIRVVSKKTLLQSLRVSTARFHLCHKDETYHNVRALPWREGRLDLDGVERVEPTFYVTSSQTGMAGLVQFTLRALIGDVNTAVNVKDNVLVTDGLKRIALGGVPIEKLEQVKHFSLSCGDRVLGNLTLEPAPQADFNAEGGFAPLDDFLWSAAAEEQLNDRLGKLLDGE